MIWLPVVGNYADIDVYASIIAYVDLLNQRNKPAKTYIPMLPNYSVPECLRMPERENTTFDFRPSDQAIILDISIPEVINRLVPDHQILELIDHHGGYEQYWQERIGSKAIIEKIGAVATSIYEWWGECWDYNKMSPKIAKLLLAAILDNTLNFNAYITTERDHQAARGLAKAIGTSVEEFAGWYFSEVSKTVLSDLSNSLLNDAKPVSLPRDGATFTFYQLTLWSLEDNIDLLTRIKDIVSAQGKNWVVSVLCISERKNYISASSKEPILCLEKTIKLKDQNGWFNSDRLYLRKEIIDKSARIE